jgi:RNA polymerase sigma-70 factor (ECF subfamily)
MVDGILSGMDDHQLLEKWREGDDRAGRALFERHIEAMTRFFRSKVDRDVEDLVQDTFLGLVRSRDAFRADASVRTLLYVIARRRLYDHLARKRRDPIDFTERSACDLGASPSQVLASKQQDRLLLRALRSIPFESQIAVELTYWEGLSGPEIAEILGIPANTVRGRLARARAALDQALQRLAESPDALASTRDNLEQWALAARERGAT